MNFGSLMAVILLPVSSGCGSAPPAPDAMVKSGLAPTGTLRIAVFTGNPVIGTRDKTGVQGTTAQLGRELAARAGLAFVLVEYTSVAKVVEDAKANAWDIAVVAFDPARRNVLDFAPPHMVVDLTYLVAPGSGIKSAADADKAGVRIGAARGAATALLLERTLKNAMLVPAENEPAVFESLRAGNVDAIAQNRFLLLGLADRLPGSRVVSDRFAAAEMTIVLPKGRTAALAYVGEFVADAKKSGSVARAIDASGLRGVSVAP